MSSTSKRAGAPGRVGRHASKAFRRPMSATLSLGMKTVLRSSTVDSYHVGDFPMTAVADLMHPSQQHAGAGIVFGGIAAGCAPAAGFAAAAACRLRWGSQCL